MTVELLSYYEYDKFLVSHLHNITTWFDILLDLILSSTAITHCHHTPGAVEFFCNENCSVNS